jgi:Domain of unknown function (DUF4164)
MHRGFVAVDLLSKRCISYPQDVPDVPHGCRLGHPTNREQDFFVSETIAAAMMRLSAAIDRLDAASLRLSDGESHRTSLETEIMLMREDRHRLARDLDLERAARERAEEGLGEISPRVDRAMAAIRAALAEG